MMRQAIAPRLAMRTLSNIRYPNQNLERRWVIGVAGIVELRAIGNEHDEIHGGAHFHVLPRTAQSVGKSQAAVRRHRHIHEEVDIVADGALAETQSIVLRDGQK